MSLCWGWLATEKVPLPCSAVMLLSAGGPCQLDEVEQAVDAIGRSFSPAVPELSSSTRERLPLLHLTIKDNGADFVLPRFCDDRHFPSGGTLSP